jgi:hypothetical protein
MIKEINSNMHHFLKTLTESLAAQFKWPLHQRLLTLGRSSISLKGDVVIVCLVRRLIFSDNGTLIPWSIR